MTRDPASLFNLVIVKTVGEYLKKPTELQIYRRVSLWDRPEPSGTHASQSGSVRVDTGRVF